MTPSRTTGLVIALLTVIAALVVSLLLQSQRVGSATERAAIAEAAIEDLQRLQRLNSTQAKARAVQAAKVAQKAQEVQHEVRGRVVADPDTVGRLQELADTINPGIVP